MFEKQQNAICKPKNHYFHLNKANFCIQSDNYILTTFRLVNPKNQSFFQYFSDQQVSVNIGNETKKKYFFFSKPKKSGLPI